MDCSGTRFLHTNHQGSVIAVADCNGNRIAINSYDEYGIPAGLVAGSAPNTGRFQYTGQIWLSELGMYYYKARIYSPFIGRFMQTDPIGYEDQVNLYAYVGNDPVNLVDPTGTETGCITLNSGCGMNRPVSRLESRRRELAFTIATFAIPTLGAIKAAQTAANVKRATDAARTVGIGKTVEAAEATLPGGVTRNIFAEVGVWQTKGGVAAAATRSRSVSSEAIQGLKDAKVSKDAVRAWQKFYQGATETVKSDGTKIINETAKYRAEVLNNVLRNW